MSQPREKNASWIAHTLEIAAAIGVLSAVVIPALVFPAMNSPADASRGDADNYEFEAASSGTSPVNRSQKRYQRPGPKTAPNVSPDFAIDAIKRLSVNFDFARQMLIAKPHVTDAEVAELVELAQMGDIAPTSMRSESFVLWDWVVNIEAIDVSSAREITDASAEEIVKLPSLKDVNISNSRLTDRGLEKIASLRNLNFLNVSGTQITDEGMKSLRELRNIEILELAETSISDAGLQVIENHPNLVSLTVSQTRVTGASLKLIGQHPLLESLDLSDCRIDDESLYDIADLRQLGSLILTNTSVTDEGLEALAGHDQLVELNLRGARIGRRGQTLIETALPLCDITY